MSLAEVVAAALTAFLASASIVPYLMDAAGFVLMPHVVLAASVVIAVAVGWRLMKGVGARHGPAKAERYTDALAWAGVVCAVTAWLLRIAWPSLLPPGGGSDLTHHLLLVDYLERAGHLVHDRGLGGAIGEMANYTPGAHLLAVMAGAWTSTDGFRAFYSVIAVCTGLTAGFIYLIARRLPAPVPFAIVGVMLLLLPLDYFIGAFTHDAFLAQAVCACFTVAAWWALVVWEERPRMPLAAVFGLFVTAAFLAWPVWIGPPLLAFAAVMLRRHVALGWRIRHFAVAIAPLALVAGIHAAGRLGWVLIVRTSGAVLTPSLAVVGWVFPLLAAIGLVVALRTSRARVTLVVLLAIAVQATTLWIVAIANGAETPYMAFKMGYLAIYPLAILGALALHAAVSRAARPVQSTAGWLVATIMVIGVVRPAINAPRQVPVVTLDLYDAGRWTRANVGAECADYLVGSADTAYWLHLAVLGNPRSSTRTAEIDRFNPGQVMGEWVASRGRGYAVADLRLLPDEVRRNVQVVKEFGRAAVIRRPGGTISGCDFRQ
jgi:xanthosine utilization system XapX-like protein